MHDNESHVYFEMNKNWILAASGLTAPPSCLPTTGTAVASTMDDDVSSATDELLTVEQIKEIFEKQMKKLEDSTNVEVNNSRILSYLNKIMIFLCLLEKNSRWYK